MVLEVPPDQVPALAAALARDRDHFMAIAAEPDQLEEDREEAVRCVSLAASWIAELPRLEVGHDAAGHHLAPLLEHYARTALEAGAFAEARDLLTLRTRLAPYVAS
jgi:hypothetical protein